MVQGRLSQINLLGPSLPHEVRAFRQSNEITAPERVYCIYYHTGFTRLPAFSTYKSQTWFKRLWYYQEERRRIFHHENFYFILLHRLHSRSPILLNNLFYLLWTLNWKNHFYFICIRKFDIFWSNKVKNLVCASMYCA